jgi:DNA polymerase (family 10)
VRRDTNVSISSEPGGQSAVTLAGTLSQLAALARIRGDAAEERLLRDAEALVRTRRIDSDADLGTLLDNPPSESDPDVLRPLRHMYEAGAWVLFESAIADLPADLRWLYESAAVSLEQLALLYEQRDVTALADLTAAIDEQAIRSVAGLDETVEQAVAAALPNLRIAISRIPLGRAVSLVDPVVSHLRSLPGIEWALPAGPLRRAEDMVSDIEVVAAASDPSSAVDTIVGLPEVDRLLLKSPRRVYLLMNRTQIGVRFPKPDNAGSTLLYLTGSAGHFNLLRERASDRGWRLTSGGLHEPNGVLRAAASEEEIYAALDLPVIPPEIRNGDDEVAAAEHGALPRLLTAADIRGDLHMHSVWSDGRDAIATMVSTCRDLGYEYMAITDHSPASGLAQSLTVQNVRRQADEVEQLREQFPEIAILHGCEVDILPEGRLDFPDRVLEGFDIVLASLHHRGGDGPDQLLRRYLAAMRHPLVTLITHPTNRLVPHRRGYELDYDRLIEGAVETGTLLEIDGAPAHLDMDGALSRRAIAAGATVTVDSDCHRADRLARQMHLGVITARRGWVEARHVLNTRPLAGVRAFIAQKRAR